MILYIFWCNMTFANEYGECIEGDCKNGRGTYLVGDDWAVKSIYIGEFKNGRWDGQGTLILNGDTNGNPNGVTLIGTWKEGKKLDAQLIHDKFNQERIRSESKKRNAKLYVKDAKKSKKGSQSGDEKLSKTKEDQLDKIMDKIEIAKFCYLKNPDSRFSDIYSEMLLMIGKFGYSGVNNNNNPNETYLFIAEGRANQLITFLGCKT